MTRSHRPWRTLAIAILAVLAVSAGGAAFAFWSGAGYGASTGSAYTPMAVTLSAGTPSDALHPGGTASVVVSVSNPNPHPVRVGSFALDQARGAGGFVVDGAHAGCSPSTLSFTTQTNGGGGWTVPAANGAVPGELDITIANSLTMGIDASDACQGASILVYLVAGT